MPLAGFSWQNVVNGDGVGIAVTGMLIVFSALTLITVFIFLLPKILAALSDVLPAESEGPHGHAHPAPQKAPAELPDGDEALAAAIGFAMHMELIKRNQS